MGSAVLRGMSWDKQLVKLGSRFLVRGSVCYTELWRLTAAFLLFCCVAPIDKGGVWL